MVVELHATVAFSSAENNFVVQASVKSASQCCGVLSVQLYNFYVDKIITVVYNCTSFIMY